jgi:hypothetical protein
MVAGLAGLAHATRLDPNSPFLHVSYIFIFFSLYYHILIFRRANPSAQVLQSHKKYHYLLKIA